MSVTVANVKSSGALGPVVCYGVYGPIYSAQWNGRNVFAKALDVLRCPVAFEVSDPEVAMRLSQSVLALLQSLSSLQHPNVEQVYGGIHQRPHNRLGLIVAERLDGMTLQAYLRQNPRQPWRFVLACMQQLLSALQAVHARGLCHGTLSPTNIMVVRDSDFDAPDSIVTTDDAAMLMPLRLKICDVGLADIIGSVSSSVVVAASAMWYVPSDPDIGAPANDVFSVGMLGCEMVLRNVVDLEFETVAPTAYRRREDRSAVMVEACKRAESVSPPLAALLQHCCMRRCTSAEASAAADKMYASTAPGSGGQRRGKGKKTAPPLLIPDWGPSTILSPTVFAIEDAAGADGTVMARGGVSVGSAPRRAVGDRAVLLVKDSPSGSLTMLTRRLGRACLDARSAATRLVRAFDCRCPLSSVNMCRHALERASRRMYRASASLQVFEVAGDTRGGRGGAGQLSSRPAVPPLHGKASTAASAAGGDDDDDDDGDDDDDDDGDDPNDTLTSGGGGGGGGSARRSRVVRRVPMSSTEMDDIRARLQRRRLRDSAAFVAPQGWSTSEHRHATLARVREVHERLQQLLRDSADRGVQAYIEALEEAEVQPALPAPQLVEFDVSTMTRWLGEVARIRSDFGGRGTTAVVTSEEVATLYGTLALYTSHFAVAAVLWETIKFMCTHGDVAANRAALACDSGFLCLYWCVLEHGVHPDAVTALLPALQCVEMLLTAAERCARHRGYVVNLVNSHLFVAVERILRSSLLLDPMVTAAAFEVLALIASAPLSDVDASGLAQLCSAVVVALAVHLPHVAVQVPAMRLLCALAEKSSWLNLPDGFVTVIVDCMIRHAHNPQLLSLSMSVMRRLSLGSPDSVGELLILSGVVDLGVAAMRAFPLDADVQRNALRLLSVVVVASSFDPRCGVVEACVAAVRQCDASACVCEDAAGALEFITKVSTLRAEHVTGAGAAFAVVKALRHHAADAVIARALVAVVVALAQYPSRIRPLVMAEAMDGVLAAYRHHSSDAALSCAIATAVAAMVADTEKGAPAFMRCDGMECLLAAVRTSEDMMDRVMTAFMYLVDADADASGGIGLVEALAAAMRRYVSDVGVVGVVCHVLVVACGARAAVDRLAAVSGFVDVLVTAVRLCGDSKMLMMLLALLRLLATVHQHVSERFVARRGAVVVRDQLRRFFENEDLQREALRALAPVAKSAGTQMLESLGVNISELRGDGVRRVGGRSTAADADDERAMLEFVRQVHM